jgi:hypothetical protein
VRCRLARLLAALGITVAAAVAGSIAVSVPAHAASCSGENCVGVDPFAAGCSTTSTTSAIFQNGSAIATIENHYSHGCNTNWAVAYENSAAQNAGYRLAITIDTSWHINFNGNPNYARYQETCYPNPTGILVNTNLTSHFDQYENCSGSYGGAGGWPMWTDMINGQYWTFATMYVYNSSGTLVSSPGVGQ